MKMIEITYLTEARQAILAYLKKLLPTWPEYVIKDWIYRPYSKQLHDKRDSKEDWILMKANILELISNEGLSPSSKWTFVPNMKFNMDMWNDWTVDKLQKRWGGKTHPDIGVTNDAERHATQAELAKQQGGVRKEPVILCKKGNKYELIEGWHRTIQHFKQYPDGYIGPAWIAVSNKV